MLVFASICPHPPLIIPTIGRQQLNSAKATVEAMEKLSVDFAVADPETTIVISPHGPVQYNEMTILNSAELEGSFYNFGDMETKKFFKNDIELVEAIKSAAEANSIPVELIDKSNLDHGTLVPLYYLAKKSKTRIVPISFSYLDMQTHFKFGQIIGRLLTASNKRYSIVASGDLSHRITFDAPAGYSPKGKEFDKTLVELIQNNGTEKIVKLDKELIEEAGECGLRSIVILLGALLELNYNFEVLSYEAPFGVGYLTAGVIIKNNGKNNI